MWKMSDIFQLDIYRGPTDIVSLVQYASEMAEKEVDDVLPEQEVSSASSSSSSLSIIIIIVVATIVINPFNSSYR